jgi:eukaryotic-like serine/threonine-protein kinase
VPYRDLGNVYNALGNLEKASEEYREALRLEPNAIWNYGNLASNYMHLNRLEEAEAVLKNAEERNLKGYLVVVRYHLAFQKGDAAQMAQLASAAMGEPGVEDQMLVSQADTAGRQGKMKDADEFTRRAMDSARHNDALETAAAYQIAGAIRAELAGFRDQARGEAQAAVKLAPNRDVRGLGAIVLARTGDTATAEKLAREIDKEFPQDTFVQRSYLPTIRAAVALDQKDPGRAIELLKTAGAIELGGGAWMYLIHVRGQAYLMLHDGKAAAAEFQKFIDHWGLASNDPLGALARLGLARAYALQGDPAKAKAAYQDFLTLWKDADPDIPIFIAAKAEYAKLQ